MTRAINLIAVHCTATMEGRPFNVAAIRAMHKAQGWSDIGYHWLIELDGKLSPGRPEATIGSHIKGHNANSIGVCYVGGIGADGKPKDTRTEAQKVTLARLLKEKRVEFPRAIIRGHRDMSPDLDRDGVVERHEWLKACPCFDVREWCKAVGIEAL